MQFFQGGPFQAEGIQRHTAPGGFADQEIGHARRQEDQHQQQPLVHHEIGYGDHTLGNGGQIRAQIREGGDKHGHGLDHDDDEHHNGHKNHDEGVGQGADDLAPELGLLVVIDFQPGEALFQGTGGFTGPDGLDKGNGQIRHIVFKALGQGITAGHILGNL